MSGVVSCLRNSSLVNSGLRVFISSKQVTRARFSCPIGGFCRLRGVFLSIFSIFTSTNLVENENNTVMSGVVSCLCNSSLVNSGLRVFISSKQVTRARFSCPIGGFCRLRGVFLSIFSIFTSTNLVENENNTVMSGVVSCLCNSSLVNSGLRVFISSKQVTRARFSCSIGGFCRFFNFSSTNLVENENNTVMSGVVSCLCNSSLVNSGLRVFISSKQVTRARFSCSIGGFCRFFNFSSTNLVENENNTVMSGVVSCLCNSSFT
jgi:hypothetical protein